jgi:hypothetical protein
MAKGADYIEKSVNLIKQAGRVTAIRGVEQDSGRKRQIAEAFTPSKADSLNRWPTT